MDTFFDTVFIPVFAPVLLSIVLALLNLALERIHPELSVQLVPKHKESYAAQKPDTSKEDSLPLLQSAVYAGVTEAIKVLSAQLDTISLRLEWVHKDLQRLEALMYRLEDNG